MDRTVHTETLPNGMPVVSYNDVIEGDGFYISYNNHDTVTYGCDTTALVVGQMEHFYILNGNHVKEYSALIKDGFSKCFEYFKNNIDKINKSNEGGSR